MRAGIAGAGIGLLAAAVLSACGGSGGGGGNAASTSTSASSPSSSAASAAASSSGGSSSVGQGSSTMVQVTAKEYALSLSTTSFSPGTYTFQLTNAGTTMHGLEIDGPGVQDQKADLTTPGSSSSITVTLKAGKYELYCPVPGHRELGMESDITVG